MRRTVALGATVSGAVVAIVLTSVLLGLRFPGMDTQAALSAREQMNADNASKILEDEDVHTFALPDAQPEGLEFLTTVRATTDAFELAIQHHGTFFALCDGDDDPDSACDAPSAKIIRDELVDGRTVRIARINVSETGDADKMADLDLTAVDEQEALEFWRTATLTRGGAPAWVSALAQTSPPDGR